MGTNLVCDLIGDPRAVDVLASGKAYERFEQMVQAQGGDLSHSLKGLSSCTEWVYTSPKSGVVTECDAFKIGYASVLLGGGRSIADAPIHHGVGIMVDRKIGDQVHKGDPLCRVYHVDSGFEEARYYIEQAYGIQELV